ncbi:MAG: universal stress protein [Blastocatellia bacterium]|nr:universal stress protein [Blastocatellia bacterium]
MSEPMKILIGYDGSSGSEALFPELWRSGLPAEAEVLVISVGEAWGLLAVGFAGLEDTFASESIGSLKEAVALAREAAERIQGLFPHWQVTHRVEAGSPARVLIQKADSWKPDLVFLGSHGHTSVGRFLWGSVSHSVVTHANCSVHIARAGGKVVTAPIRLIVGADGSPDADAAVQAVASRKWPEGTEVRVVTAYHSPPAAPSIGLEEHENAAAQMAEWLEKEKTRAVDTAARATETLTAAGLIVSAIVKKESPKRLLVHEAGIWDADCIFVGARGLGRLERILLGSVSTAVTMHAACSVEVVRPQG